MNKINPETNTKRNIITKLVPWVLVVILVFYLFAG